MNNNTSYDELKWNPPLKNPESATVVYKDLSCLAKFIHPGLREGWGWRRFPCREVGLRVFGSKRNAGTIFLYFIFIGSCRCSIPPGYSTIDSITELVILLSFIFISKHLLSP